MPTPSTSDLPKPRSWDEFEDIVWNIYTRRWRDANAQRYGRSGQAQKGVDIYGREYESQKYIAIQCKRYEDGKLNSSAIAIEIDKTKSFPAPIDGYIVATTMSRDTKLQDSVRELNQQRELENNFSVHIVFWEDICSYLAEPANYDLLKKHYVAWGEVFGNQNDNSIGDKIQSAKNKIDGLVSKRLCTCINYFGVFLISFLEDELGHKMSHDVVHQSVCTVSKSYESSAVDAIVSTFSKKNMKGQSNVVDTATGSFLTWEEFLINAFQKIKDESENLLIKYGSTCSQELILAMEGIKDVSNSMIGLTLSCNTLSEQEEDPCRKVRQEVYAEKFIKPYLLEMIEFRMLVVEYSCDSERNQ